MNGGGGLTMYRIRIKMQCATTSLTGWVRVPPPLPGQWFTLRGEEATVWKTREEAQRFVDKYPQYLPTIEEVQ